MCFKNFTRSPFRTWHETFNCEKREQFCFNDIIFSFLLDSVKKSLFCLIGSYIYFESLLKRSFTNWWNCCFPQTSFFLSVLATFFSTIYCVSNTSLLCYKTGLPISSTTTQKVFTCIGNAFCWLLTSSWCRIPCPLL